MEKLRIYQDSFFERSTSYTTSDVLAIVEEETAKKSVMVLEGPPIYLWPQPSYPSQQWYHPAFTQGWSLTTAIGNFVAADKIQHFVLVDDYNYRPEGEVDLERRALELGHQAPALVMSPVFDGEANILPVQRYLESAFVQENGNNQCSSLDAQFQREKILHQLMEGRVDLSSLNQLLLVVVHPQEFQSQQSIMLSSLLGLMKDAPFQQIPRKKRPGIVSEMYRHIWLDDTGNITNVTQPHWDGNKFIFNEIS